MKVMLINPPFSQEEVVGSTQSMKHVANIIPPLGLCYVAAYLEKEGHNVQIIDGQLTNYKETLERFQKFLPDAVGMAATTPTFLAALTLSEELKTLKSCPIIVGGNHVAKQPQHTLSYDCFDFGIIGEAEITMANLLQALEKNQPLDNVKGIAFKKDGEVIVTKGRDFIKNLDELPFPAYHLIPHFSNYHPTPASYRRLPHADIITSRGCPYSCTFCDNGVFGRSYRERSPENVVAEIKMLKEKYGIKDIKFFDDIFTLNKKRLKQICELLIQEKINIPWACLTRVDLVDKETLQMMKKAGCWQVLFGMESGDQRILDLIDKRTTVEQNRKAAQLCHEVGITVRADYLFGVPGDSLESMQKTLDFAISINTDFAHFNKFTPYPGNQIYEQLVKKGHKFNFEESWTQQDHERTHYVPEGVDKEKYLNFINHAHRKYYLRPAYLAKQLFGIRSKDDISRLYRGFKAISGL